MINAGVHPDFTRTVENDASRWHAPALEAVFGGTKKKGRPLCLTRPNGLSPLCFGLP